MSHFTITEPAAHLVDTSDIERFEVMGPVVEYLTPLRKGELCVMRGTIPPSVSVPLHAHADPETFLMVSGEVEGFVRLRKAPNGFQSGPATSSMSRAARSTPSATGKTTRRRW